MKYLFVILLSVLSCTVFAQSASELFQSARAAYEKGDNSTAIQLLRSCEAALGRSNPRIESLRALCYANEQDWVNASVALNTYFRTAPASNAGTEAHKDMLALKEKVDSEINEADRKFKEKLDKKRMDEAKEFEQQQVSEEMSRINEVYRNSTDPDELQQFLTMFPNSPRANEIKFKKYVSEGDRDMNARRWTPAVENFTKALNIKSDATVKVKLVKAQDEQAYALAVQKNTIEEYESYLSKFPSGIHKEDADAVLQKNYLRLAREYVTSNDFNNAVYYYKAYQNRYPQGPEIKTVNAELCNYYLAEAKKAEKVKSVSSVQRAIELYTTAKQCENAVSQSHLKSLNRKVKRWSRPDESFMGWHADETNLIGFMVGGLKSRKVDWYFSGRTGSGFFKTKASWETDSKNSLQESVNKDKKFTGTIIASELYANIGLTKRIVYPLWIYAGAGVAFNTELREFKSTTGSDEELVENKDAKFTAFNPEGGLYMLLGPFVLRYGINKPMSAKYTGSLIQHFGIAFKL
jgi:tetratricopeptide (TPR) repeat protein